MSTQAETMTAAFEQAMESFQKTSEAAVNMQQEAIRQWAGMWPQAAAGKSDAQEQFQQLQKRCGETVAELLKRHRETVDKQFEESTAALEEVVRLGESKSPDEFRVRMEQLCRKSLELMRHSSELQIKEFQEAIAKWSDAATKAAS